jgi:hypothetical protein
MFTVTTGGVLIVAAMNNQDQVVDLATRRAPVETDYGQLAQEAAEKHLTACWEAYWAEEETEDLDSLPESPACAPFDGCETCVVREVLFAAWPFMERSVEDPQDPK